VRRLVAVGHPPLRVARSGHRLGQQVRQRLDPDDPELLEIGGRRGDRALHVAGGPGHRER
jgi:hypothetical protein